MASSQLQNDKDNAMKRFQRKRNLENYLLYLFNLCAFLFLFSHSHSYSYSNSFPITLQTLHHLYHLFISLFHNSFYAFLLLNAIILFLFALSNNNNNVGPQEQPRTVESSDRKVATVCDSEVGESLSTVAAVTETTTTVSDEKKCYRRVRSESFERRMVVAPRRELKRCNTGEAIAVAVEQLSEDEFNRAVEDFIAKHKRMQSEEHSVKAKIDNFHFSSHF